MKKQELRKLYLEKRLFLSEQEYLMLNQQLLMQFMQLELSDITAVHVFLPLLRTKEVDTLLIIRYLKETYPHIKRVFPKMHFKQKMLTNFVDDEQLLIKENKFGIPEPVSGNQFYIDKNSMVIVPLLAFDELGNRVGYGGGFYDRFLAECATGTQFIGLSLFEPVDLIEDADELDIKLHQCVTPKKVWKF